MNVPDGKKKPKNGLYEVASTNLCFPAAQKKLITRPACWRPRRSVMLFVSRPSGDEGRLCLLANYG